MWEVSDATAAAKARRAPTTQAGAQGVRREGRAAAASSPVRGRRTEASCLAARGPETTAGDEDRRGPPTTDAAREDRRRSWAPLPTGVTLSSPVGSGEAACVAAMLVLRGSRTNEDANNLIVLKKASRELGSNKVASNWMLPFEELDGCENFDLDSQTNCEANMFGNLEQLKVDSRTEVTPTTARMDPAFGESSHLVVPMAAIVEGVGTKSPATMKAGPVATGTATPTMLQGTIGTMCHPVDKQICRFKGCTNAARRRGLCRKHGINTDKLIATCQFEGCRNKIVNKGLCLRHGASKNTCHHEGCNNYAVRRGVCKRHGATTIRKRCRHEGCHNFAQRRGVCKFHGADK